MSALSPLRATALALAVVAAGAAAMAVAVRVRGGSPRAAAFLRLAVRPGDLAVVLDDPGALGAYHGLPVVAAMSPAPSWDAFRRIWVVATRDAPLGAFVARFGPWTTVRGGATRVVRFDAGAARDDLLARFHPARVERGGEVCAPRGARHACTGPSYLGVEIRTETFDGERVRCVLAHPSKGSALALTFPDTPPGVLRGAGGFTDYAARHPRGATVELAVEYPAGRRLATLAFPNGRGLKPFVVRLAPGEAAADLRLIVTAPDIGARHFYFGATVREP